MKKEKGKLNLFWKMAVLVSFFLYYFGLVDLYNYYRKHFNKKPQRIILAYHRVNINSNDAEMTIDPKRFGNQMSYLARKYRVVSLVEIIHMINQTQKDLAAITFDDGYADNFQFVFPVLKKNHFSAMIFLITNKVGCIDKDMLTLNQIKEMQIQGISFGSHTCTHPVLADIPLEQAEEEIRQSKMILESTLGEKVEFFAYPRGKKCHYGNFVKEIVSKCGYKYALTMENRAIKDPLDFFEIPRIGIRDVPMFVFKTRLSGIFESSFILFFRKLIGAI